MDQRDRGLPSRQITIAMGAGLALFLALMPFHLVIKRLLPDPVGTYWKEGVLGLVLLGWVALCVVKRRLTLTRTTVDLAIGAYLVLLLAHALLERTGWTTAWGLYISVMYLPLAWLIPAVLEDRPVWLSRLLWLLVGLGALIALGGIAEFMLNRALWPSSEMVERLGSPDMYIYGTHVRRVYFTFDSPTTLANTLGLLLPIATALAIHPLDDGPASGRARVFAALSAVLMAMCIVLTFSRGIWVATLIGLAAFGSAMVFRYGDRRMLFAVAGVLAIAGLVWGIAAISTRNAEVATENRIIELSSVAYADIEVAERNSLLSAQPKGADAETQTWTLQDPVSLADDTREVVFLHPSESGEAEIAYEVEVPESGALKYAIAISPEVWGTEYGDGVEFRIYVDAGAQDRTLVFSRYVNPKQNPSDRRWRNYVLDLSDWAGQDVEVLLATTGGPAGDWGFDWSGWSDLQVGVVDAELFESSQGGGAILRHTQSILNWSTDETNRDRLAAWSQGVRAWLNAPILGRGLGSTGVAALRTQPQTALVTESQVLKSLVELGLPGLVVWGWLWFEIARVGMRALSRTQGAAQRTLILGVLTSLLIVFIEGWVYQNLEVKQVNAFFWVLVGVAAHLARTVNEQ
ncbi:MAG: O-antigen ligase family protein [Chloroflexi bacterium]|nr:O-antigen ligase family protein [Chloroflexota bacterium]